jgi:hypothetical protein
MSCRTTSTTSLLSLSPQSSYDSDANGSRDSDSEEVLPFDMTDSPSPTVIRLKTQEVQSSSHLLKHIFRRSSSEYYKSSKHTSSRLLVSSGRSVATLCSKTDIDIISPPLQRNTWRPCSPTDLDAELIFRPSLRLQRKFMVTPMVRDEFESCCHHR